MSKPSVFNQLSAAPPSKSAKWRRFHEKRSFFDVGYPEMTSNIVGPSNTPSKSKERQLAISSEEFDIEPSSVLKEILIKPKGINQHTRTRLP